MEHAERLSLARQLVSSLESGQDDEAARCLHRLQESGPTPLLRHVAELTRDVHQSLLGLGSDPQLTEMTRTEMPDARSRLAYVIEKTEDSAHRTLAAVEDMMPLVSRVGESAAAALAAHDAARHTDALREVVEVSEVLRGGLTEVLMAQEYQDLTGQVIRRTIDIVDKVERKLVALLAAELPGAQHESTRAPETGARGPVIRPEADAVTQQDDVDALLAELGL